jgi:hypothetical protein
VKCIAFKPLARGSMLGFADLEMTSGLILRGCTLLESNGRRWCNPPSRPRLDGDRKPMTDDGGKIVYAVVVDFASKTIRSRWSAEAVAAIDAYISTTPAGAGAVSGRDSSGGQPQESRSW